MVGSSWLSLLVLSAVVARGPWRLDESFTYTCGASGSTILDFRSIELHQESSGDGATIVLGDLLFSQIVFTGTRIYDTNAEMRALF
jgi:hypothetical protein